MPACMFTDKGSPRFLSNPVSSLLGIYLIYVGLFQLNLIIGAPKDVDGGGWLF